MKTCPQSFLFGASSILNVCLLTLVMFLMFCPKANPPRTINISLDELLAPPSTPIVPRTPKTTERHLNDGNFTTIFETFT